MPSTTSHQAATTGTTRRRSVATTLAAVALGLPMVGVFGGTAFAGANNRSADWSDRGTASAPGQTQLVDPPTATTATRGTPALPPYSNQGGITVGSNTTAYETVADHKGSTYTGIGGGLSSGDITTPQPYSTADKNSSGANDISGNNPYRSTREGLPSLNGNGAGQQIGQPCAGCVGKADNKNPPGQAPNATDHNAGYECDRNHGIGRSNPAHTGCTTTAVVCIPPNVNVNGLCAPPQDCKGVVNGTATAADCIPPQDCKGVVNGTATANECVFTGGGGGTATGPLAIPVNAAVPAQGGGSGAASAVGAGLALPFTGSHIAWLLEGAALLVLAGLGMLLAVRKRELLAAAQ